MLDREHGTCYTIWLALYQGTWFWECLCSRSDNTRQRLSLTVLLLGPNPLSAHWKHEVSPREQNCPLFEKPFSTGIVFYYDDTPLHLYFTLILDLV
jgi:hypothetical protein